MQQRDAAVPTDPAVAGREAVEPELVQRMLARILASPAFDAPDRNRRFLQFIVEETLAGHGDRIKAYPIAVAVFGRDQGFDPQTDPIVRIEASRLRRSLERYYLLDGADDPLRIEIPKGGYLPTFEARPAAAVGGPAEPAAAPAHRRRRWLAKRWPSTRWPSTRWIAAAASGAVAALLLLVVGVGTMVDRADVTRSGDAAADPPGPTILVMPFVDDSGLADGQRLARGFTHEVVTALTRFDRLLVFDAATGPPGTSPDTDPREAGTAFDLLVEGSVSALEGRIRVSATLVDLRSGRHLWSGRFERRLTAGDIFALRDDLADEIVGQLAQPYGVVYSAEVAEIGSTPPDLLSSYQCVLLHHEYWRRPSRAGFPAVRDCLERAIVDDPGYAEAFASLALVYVDSYRFGFGTPIDDALGQALALARRAAELAPASAKSYRALHQVLWMMQDVEGSLEAAERALSLNPNDTMVMAELGLRYATRNELGRGLPLIEKAYARNPNLPGIYRIGPFLDHYLAGRYAEALVEAQRIGTPDVLYGHVCLAMAYARLGRTQDAAATVERILALHPDYGRDVIADLEKRNVHHDVIAAVVDGLLLAGLEIPKAGL